MIHQYRLNDYNIVLDINSASVHIMDEVAYDAVGLLERELSEPAGELSPEEIISLLPGIRGRFLALHPELSGSEAEETLSELKELIEAETLFSRDAYRGLTLDLKNRKTVVKALCLLVSHTCNLNCNYCFAAQGRFKGEAGLMSFETGKRALDFLIENSEDRKNLEVDFFGGEPLLNFEVCKELVAYARSIEKEKNKNFRFTLTTNGIGITDEVIEWANRECYNVVLSLDGRKEVNDRFRKDLSGEGSYERIVPKFQDFVRRRGDRGYYIRGTYTHHNTDFTRDIFHMADDLGFTELSMEPVVCASELLAGDGPKKGTDEAKVKNQGEKAPDETSFTEQRLTEKDIPVLKEQYEILAKDMIRRRREGKPITFYHYMLDLEEGPCIYKRISGCGAGTEYLAVTAWGELYPCHQFVNDPEYKMGNIWDGLDNEKLQEEFKLCNVYAKPECRDCWARLYCAGGCSANALHATGDIHGVYETGCELFKKRIECALMLKADEAMTQEEEG